jgi:hypothetical protein
MLLFHLCKLQLSLYVDESQPYLFHGQLLLKALVTSDDLSQRRHIMLLRALLVWLLLRQLTI